MKKSRKRKYSRRSRAKRYNPREAGCITALKALVKLVTVDPTRYDSINPYSRPQVKMAMKYLAKLKGWDESKDKHAWMDVKLNPRGQTPYDELAIVPAIIAEAVTERPYTGREISDHNRDSRLVDRVEGQRRNMSADSRRAFVNWVDKKCRDAYKAKASWFMKIARSKTNVGRNQLYVFVSHWLAGYLTGGRR